MYRLKKNKRLSSKIFNMMYKLSHNFKLNYSSKSKQEKINELIRLSEIRFHNINPYECRRSGGYLELKDYCWVCKTTLVKLYHHIILIKNGGLDCRFNKICICENCHNLIHNWLWLDKKEKELNEEYQTFVALENT